MDIKELEPRLAEAERIRKMFENAPEAMRLLQSIVGQ